MNPLQFGDFEVQRVEEMIWEISPQYLFPQLSREDFEPFRDWLVPHYSTEDLSLRLGIQSFVIRTPHHTILVDTCVGNDRRRNVPVWNMMNTNYLERLAKAGLSPEGVDFVFCTHMHVDHVGWNTRLENGRWVPTFPNAKYIFHRKEWEHWKDSDEEFRVQVMEDSVLPIHQAGLAVMVEATHEIETGIQLLPTPGHTPGHSSVQISSGGSEGVITGDMIHHPAQIAMPTWSSRADTDQELSAATRQKFLERFADGPTLILGTHFAPPTAMYIESAGDSFRLRLPE